MDHVLLVYDIENDRIRSKIADICLDYGLDRIQYSTFTGCLSNRLQDSLMTQIDDVLSRESGNICLFPIRKTDWEKRIEVGNE